MARLSVTTRAVLGASAALGVLSCGRATHEGPPPAESLEIASAAPGAMGALAGGTEAAPSGFRAPSGSEQEVVPEGQDDEELEDGGAAPAPDAALESPEEIPL